MEFRRYLKERLTQLRANEALNVTETTSDGKGIRKVEFDPQTARSLVSVPYHKQIVFNLNKSLKGLDNFLRLEGYDKNKIENVHRRLRGSKVSSPRRDRELYIPPNAKLLNNPKAIYFYGILYDQYDYTKDVIHTLDFQGYIFVKANDGNFYNVYYYIKQNVEKNWFQDIQFPGLYTSRDLNIELINNSLMTLNKKQASYSADQGVDVFINLDFLGTGNTVNFVAKDLIVEQYIKTDGFSWFCKQLDGPLPDKLYYGDQTDSGVLARCKNRGIN